MDKYIEGKFSNPVNPKDGYLVGNCVDAQMHRILEFLVFREAHLQKDYNEKHHF